MLLSSRNLKIEQWDDIGSNSDQDYLTHSLFRYFGKLPPVLTSRILKEFVNSKGTKTPIVLDLMCGSGTTLVDAQKLNIRSIGVDSNDIAVLISRVKTSPIDKDQVERAIDQFGKEFEEYLNGSGHNHLNAEALLKKWPKSLQYIPSFRNIDKWFSRESKVALAVCRNWVEHYKEIHNLYDFLLVCWLGIIRQCSNASVRSGRIFHDLQKPPQPVFDCFIDKIKKGLSTFDGIPKSHFSPRPRIFLGDARNIELPLSEKMDFTFFHPPYFALYKYSSDVLRFELEWGQFDRKEILSQEIRDGFKTSNPNLVHQYVEDITQAIVNGFRHTKDHGNVAIVVGNSTLSQKQLPIIELLLDKCENTGIRSNRMIERPINHSQATYHKSANPNIRSKSDYLIVFSQD